MRKIAVFIMVSWSFFWTLSLSASAQSAHAPEPRKKTARKETLADKEKRQRAALGLNAQSPELHGELGRTLIQRGDTKKQLVNLAWLRTGCRILASTTWL
jgi:hypothetical protein